jgi:hypothetical protein
MKLSRKPCKIVGLRLGELTLNLLAAPIISGKFVLVREPSEGNTNVNAGSYSKNNWSEQTIEALQKFIDSAEQDALVDLFDDAGQEGDDEESSEPAGLSFPAVPVLGGPKRGGS